MSDIQKSRIDRPRDEGVYVSRIGEDRKEKEPYKELTDKEKQVLSATFLAYLKRLFHAFSDSRELGSRIISRMTVVENLRAFQTHLLNLQKQDLSQNAEFAQDLALSWHKMLEDFELVAIMERKNLNKSSRFRELIDTVKHYPKGSDHPLGYYLMEQIGKDWLPFPFIDLLASLHQEHLKTPSASSLKRWTGLVDEIIENLKSIKFSLEN